MFSLFPFSSSRRLRALALAFAGVGLLVAAAQAATPLDVSTTAPVNFEAKQLFHDEKAQTVTAVGDVEFDQGPKILRADKMVYHLDTDTVEAVGNVSLLDADGSVHFAEYVQLSKDMQHGFVQSLLSMLADGARFTAVEARREGLKTQMTDATYTPCKVCEADPHPVWQLKADEITHDEATKNIKYKNARLEFLGVPLAWTPLFSHADPSVKSRSGFLRPHFGWSTNLGAFAEGGYYYNMSPDKDATVLIRPTLREGVLAQGEWRQRFRDGLIKLSGSFADSDRHEEDGRVDKSQLRGDLAAEGLFDLDEKWRAGFHVRRASDKEYLRLYDIDKSDILENEAYAERFSGRDYSRVSAVNVQDLRLGLRPSQPEVAPLAEHHMLGEPRALLGGRWSADLSALDLQRPGPGQDMQRAVAKAGWERRDIYARTGLATTYNAGIEGDGYEVQQNVAAAGGNTTATRGMIHAGVTNSYPLVKRLKAAQAVIEPLAGVSYATRADNNPVEFPNEDSRDAQIDANSLFSDDRVPGLDRQEDGARVNYGARAGVYADDGRYGKVFVGQSYRFDGNGNPFPQGSGLEGRLSDFVGQVSVGLSDRFSADYRIQVDNTNLAAHRHELQATGGTDALKLGMRFIYLDALSGTGFVEPREQILVGGTYNFTKNWSVTSSTLADFSNDPGVRKASLSLGYANDCFSFSAQGQRNLITEASGENGTSIMLRVGLKNIGEFSSPSVTLKPLPKQAGTP